MQGESACVCRTSACPEPKSGSQPHSSPEISILSKLTQIPDVSSRRRVCKRKKSQRSEILTSGLYETAVKDSVQQKFITGTRGRGGRCKRTNSIGQPTRKQRELTLAMKKQQLSSKQKCTVLARHI